MGRPLRQFGPDTYWFVTDRCAEERHLLRPDPEANAIIQRCLRDALAADLGVGALAVGMMGNHGHQVLRAGPDPTSMPRFMQRFKSDLALAMNEHRDRHGAFWSERYHAIPILDDESLIDRMVYTLMNPVAAGLCSRIEEYPGVTSCEANLGVRGACGEVDIPIELPPAWQGLDAAQLAEKKAWLLREVRAREAAVKAERVRVGLPRPKPERCVTIDPYERPRRPARRRAPRCFAATKAAREAFESVWRAFVEAYDDASAAFRAGVLTTMFPAGSFPPRLERPPNEATA